MVRRIRTYNGTCLRHIPGVHHHRRQVDVRVGATSMKDAHAAIIEAGINGWSLYAFRQYWCEGGDIAETADNPGVVYYRPDSCPTAPFVTWDQEYPLDAIPDHIREKD